MRRMAEINAELKRLVALMMSGKGTDKTRQEIFRLSQERADLLATPNKTPT